MAYKMIIPIMFCFSLVSPAGTFWQDYIEFHKDIRAIPGLAHDKARIFVDQIANVAYPLSYLDSNRVLQIEEEHKSKIWGFVFWSGQYKDIGIRCKECNSQKYRYRVDSEIALLICESEKQNVGCETRNIIHYIDCESLTMGSLRDALADESVEMRIQRIEEKWIGERQIAVSVFLKCTRKWQ